MVTVYTPCCDITCCGNRNGNKDETVCGIFFCFVAIVIIIFSFVFISGKFIYSLFSIGVIFAIFGLSYICYSLITCRRKRNENILNEPHDLLRSSDPADDHSNHDANEDIESNLKSFRNQKVKPSLRNIDKHEKSLPLSSWRKKKNLSHNEKVAALYLSQGKTDEVVQLYSKEYQRREEERERERLRRKEEIEKKDYVARKK